ncbi:MAG: LPS assembly lipoprotein LptE [Haliscomenobacter sp.]
MVSVRPTPLFTLLLLLLSGLYSCYSFRGVSLDPSIKSYYVASFNSNAENATPSLAKSMEDALREKIRTESRLVYDDTKPDIEFRGTLVDFRISAEAPRTGEVTAINRLTINLAVEYYNNLSDKQIWKRNFTFFYDFSSDRDFSSIEADAIQTITKQLMEDIFNAAFSDW